MNNHLKVRWDIFQHLAFIGADIGKPCSATGRAHARGFMLNAFAR